MNRFVQCLISGVLLLAAFGCGGGRPGDVTVNGLRCEYRVNPLGIDELRPRLSWRLESGRRGAGQTAFRIIVSSGRDKLDADTGDLWDSGKVKSDRIIHVDYDGEPLAPRTRCWWKVRVWDDEGGVSEWSAPAWWETGLPDPEPWNASWIGDGKPAPERDDDFFRDDPAPLFRKELNVAKPVERARLYISGPGYYQACLNGVKIGEHVLDPGWTSYAKRVLYSTYDVTDLLIQGANAVGVELGNGWYNPLPMRMWGRLNLREYLTVGRPCFIARLEIHYSDGTRDEIVTDESWKTAAGPILKNNIYLGEFYDARREIPGWNRPGFDDASWDNAKAAPGPSGKLVAQSQPPIKVTDTIEVKEVTEPKPGVYIFDMGENFAGWVRLRVNGPAGTKVTLRFGELLYPDGTLNVMTSACGQIKPGGRNQPSGVPIPAAQSDTYILKGGGDEVYTPRFTFHGFRYVEVTGYPGKPALDALEGLRLNAAVGDAGSFECSNPMFNRIQEMVRRTFLSNIFSVQSDCPQRERFGYGGDIVPTCEAFMLNFDMSTFYPKIARDFADAARPGGGMTETAPYTGIGAEGFGDGTGPVGWTLAHPYLLERLYRYYGDRRLIEEQYEASKGLVDFLRDNADGYFIERGISDHESLVPKPTSLTSTAFYYHHVALLAELAEILGKSDDSVQYTALAGNIREAFIGRFLEPGTGRFDTHTQACQAIALHYGFVPPKELEAAFDVLVIKVLKRQEGHLSTGIFGTKFLLEVLSEFGRPDLAYAIVNQRTFPGWGHMLENGATTLWEHWEFSDNTYSHNHPMFGSVSEWFIRTLAGIGPDDNAVGFDRIVIRPTPAGDLTWAKGSYESVRGRITSDWRIEDGVMLLNVEIPPASTATVFIPAQNAESVIENGVPAGVADGVSFLLMEKGRAIFEVGSGNYSFRSKIPNNNR